MQELLGLMAWWHNRLICHNFTDIHVYTTTATNRQTVTAAKRPVDAG